MSAKLFKKGANKVVDVKAKVPGHGNAKVPGNAIDSLLTRRININNSSASNVEITLEDGSTKSFFVEDTLDSNILNDQQIERSRIKSVNIGGGVNAIATATFYGCSALQNIEFDATATLKTIGTRAFENTSLSSFPVIASVESIGDFAFSHISTLASIEVDAGNKVYSSTNGILYSKDGSSLYKYPEGLIEDVIDLSDKEVKELGVGAMENLSFVSSLYLPKNLEVCRGRAFADYSYANTEQKLTTLIIPATVNFIEPGAFDNMQLSALVGAGTSLAYSVNSFINCSVENIFLPFPSPWVKCIIGTNNNIEIKQPLETATIEDIVSSGITILDLEKYGYINSESIINAISTNEKLYGKYVNTYFVDLKDADNYHYARLKPDYSVSSYGRTPLMEWVVSDDGTRRVVGTLRYSNEFQYLVQSSIYPSWMDSIYSIDDGTISLTYTGDESMVKVDQFPALQLENGVYAMRIQALWSVKDNVLKNISTGESFVYNATTENYEGDVAAAKMSWYRALMGNDLKKTYYLEDENDHLYFTYSTAVLQSVKSAGTYNETEDVDVVVRADNFQGFSIDLAQNAMMPASAPDGVGLAYMKAHNDFSNAAIGSLTNLIKYTLTFEVSAFTGQADSCYAYLRVYGANNGVQMQSIQKTPITSIGTYTTTFLTQKSVVEEFSLEEIGIECFANTSADVHLTVSTCLLDVQIYEDNPADYYVGNSIILENGAYFYTDENDAKVIFMAYEENGNNLLKLRTGIIYIYNSEYKAYINQDDDRLFFVFTEGSMMDVQGNEFSYDVATSSVILELMFTTVNYFSTLNSTIYVSNNLTLSDFLFYSSLISNATNLFSDSNILQTMINGIYILINYLKDMAIGNSSNSNIIAQAEADRISNFNLQMNSYVPYILLKSHETDSITYWNIDSVFSINTDISSNITLNETVEDINLDGFVGQYLLQVSAE